MVTIEDHPKESSHGGHDGHGGFAIRYGGSTYLVDSQNRKKA
jgi:hypothetical protein